MFWFNMLADRPERAIPSEPFTERELAQALQYWDALTRLPEPVNPSLLRGAARPVSDAFVTLSERHPSRDRGLTNIQERLLRCTRPDWQKMARTIGDAMFAGTEVNDPVGDIVLQAALTEMAQMTPPLVDIDGKGAMRLCQVKLTPHGEAIKLAQRS